MEDALLFSPVFQYGTLFLEENQQDQALDLIYRFGFPVVSPRLDDQILSRLFAIVAFELKEILAALPNIRRETDRACFPLLLPSKSLISAWGKRK